MSIEKLIKKATQLLVNTSEGVFLLREKNKFMLLKHSKTSELNATLYEPVLCLILQGAKEVATGERELRFGKGESLIVSHEIPVVSRITEASSKEPYIALILGLDINIVRSLYEEFGESALSMEGAKAIEVEKANDQLLDSLYRLVESTQNEIDSLVLFTQILREVHFRLLQAPYGGMLRDLLRVDSHASNISKAITIIRRKFNEHLSVAVIAKSVGMSTSSFHQHFKTITESTPLQYQKDLRLLEARRLIKMEGESVTTAALEVGYESPNQFSREYTRKFAVNPSADANSA
ncbi:MAG: AraC family transcriptional regulator [Deltaproteobacteria bacterium]|nr:AraC family transcriptional regulator [Deltaproteobacteria bacterium]